MNSVSPTIRTEKTKNPQNPPKGLTILKTFLVPGPLNILCPKPGVLNSEGDNDTPRSKPRGVSVIDVHRLKGGASRYLLLISELCKVTSAYKAELFQHISASNRAEGLED